MDTFAFIIHPLDPKADAARKYPRLARVVPVPAIHFLSRFWPPLVLSHVKGVRSEKTGQEVEGWLLACPLTARQLMRLPPQVVYRKIIQTGRLAERLGAHILGLGAYTSVVGDAGLTVARALDVPVTTGDSYTVALALRTLLDGGRQMGIETEQATVAIVGASGAIGSACAHGLARQVKEMILVSRNMPRLEQVRKEIEELVGGTVETTTDIMSIRRADLIITATSAGKAIVHSEHLKPGAVVCDVARPRDVSSQVVQERDDVLILDGGLAEVPGEADFGFDYSLPAGYTFGCMAETIALALEGRFEDFTIGKTLEIERVQTIERIAEQHGFRPAGLRSFDRPVSTEQVQFIRRKAAQAAESGPA